MTSHKDFPSTPLEYLIAAVIFILAVPAAGAALVLVAVGGIMGGAAMLSAICWVAGGTGCW